ncbi:MAG TPA: hypothetical protein VMS29_03090 [Pyrinomonadaceae bacterium]|jgi:hypothetical protein|nr:hypothetical protein [Pyrinomonadaceae bacterium]
MFTETFGLAIELRVDTPDMKLYRSLAIIIAFAFSAFAQTNNFSDPSIEFSFEIPTAKWKQVGSTSSGNVEFVYADRNDGHLEIRKITSPRNTPMADVIKDQEDKLQFRPGYVTGKQENFNGKLPGSVFNFEFVKSGRPMTGRYYFLRSGDRIYILRFEGFQDSLRSIRPQTDSIARTFGVRAVS